MKIGENIRTYRESISISQESLAEKVYVSRQTISNWENGKSYPDLNSLILLSDTFNMTIDHLIKGDINIMKNKIKEHEITQFNRLAVLFTISFLLVIITPIPLVHFLGKTGIAIWAVISIFAIYIAFLVEKEKKKYNVQTYKEIIAFTEGKKLDEISRAREEGKRVYQKVFYAFASALLAIVIALIFIYFFNL